MCISGLTWEDDRVVCVMASLLKHNKEGQSLDVIKIKKFTQDRELCPVRTLREYIRRTKDIRGDTDQLFISFKGGHRVVRSTISRWVRMTLRSAGVDIDVYKPHSTRGAATSKAVHLQVPLETILKRAKWTNCQTFARFYKRQIEETWGRPY